MEEKKIISHSDSNVSQTSNESTYQVVKEKYSASKLMMMLDKQKLEALEEEFKFHPEGIELPNFVWLMKCAMNVPDEERAELVLGLYYLFQEIDINGDEHMDWAEFTQYIIDAVMNHQLREKIEDKQLNPSEIIEIAYSVKSKKYKPCQKIDKNIHSSNIKYLFYNHSIDSICFIENFSQSIKICDSNFEVKHSLTPQISDKSFILAVAYSEKDLILAAVCSDRKFYLYEKDKETFRFLRFFPTDFTHSGLWYLEKLKIWVSACDDLGLRQWKIRRGECVGTYRGHKELVMDIAEIVNLLKFVTCSLDGSIIIWNAFSKEKSGIIAGEHTRGVRCIDYCSEAGGNIVSVGYEREICVWCPELNLSKCLIGKLEGHVSSVISCKFFTGSAVCVSIDEKASIRIWDVRQLTCLQLISNEKGNIITNKLITLAGRNKFVIAGKRMIGFELEVNNSGKDIYFDAKPLAVEFNTYYMQFIVLTKFDVRVYDCVTGKLKKIYVELSNSLLESEYCSLVLDHRNRLFIIGNTAGTINSYNFANGKIFKPILTHPTDAKIEEKKQEAKGKSKKKNKKKINKEKQKNNEASEGLEKKNKERLVEKINFSEISAMHYCIEDKILIAANWSSALMIYDLKNMNSINLLRYIEGGHENSDITCLTHSFTSSLIASGSSNGIVSIWNFELARLEFVFFLHSKEITNLTFLDPYPVLMTSSSDGISYLWNIKTQEFAINKSCVLGIQSYDKNIKNHFVAGLNHVKIGTEFNQVYGSKTKELVYIGDTEGNIKILNFQKFFESKGIFIAESSEKKGNKYNPRRKEVKNVEIELKYWKKLSNSDFAPEFINANDPLICENSWKAHDDRIVSIKLIPDPEGVLTCSKDKTLKVWDTQGQIWGVINLASPDTPKNWNFPYKWESKRQKDLKKIVEILSAIDNEVDIDPHLQISEVSVQKSKKKKVNNPNPLENSINKIDKNIFRYKTKKSKNYFGNTVTNEISDEEIQIYEQKFVKEEVKNEFEGLDLKKKLDEIDEKRGKDLASPVKRKVNKNELDLKIYEYSNKKLPKININNMENKEIAFQFNLDRNNHGFQSRASNSNSISLRSIGSRNIFGSLNYKINLKFGSNGMSSQKIKPNKSSAIDFKYKIGESTRMMQKAISVHSLNQNSLISPFTEDLKILNEKRKVIGDLIDEKSDLNRYK